MLLLAQSRNVDMKEVLSFSLGTFALSLSTEMGTLHKTQKSKLMTLIESSVQNHTVENIPEGNALILDGMALIQTAKKLPASFRELAEHLLTRVVKLGVHQQSSHVDFVIDRYPDVTIKNLERSMQANTGVTVVDIYGPEQKLPAQWGKFLKHGSKKESLVQFLFECWCTVHTIPCCSTELFSMFAMMISAIV